MEQETALPEREVVPQTPPPVASEKKTRRYQPTYPEGHELAGQPMGGEQIIEYDGTEDDLFAKMVANNNRLTSEMRRYKVESSVAPQEGEEALPAGAQSRKQELFKHRDLSPAERLQLAKDLLNPEKIQEAYDTLAAARIGSNEDFKGMTERQMQMAEHNAGLRFGREHPEIVSAAADTLYTNPYGYKTKVPRDTYLLLTWCDKRDLYHTYGNLMLAFERLKKAGLLSEAPIAAQEVPPKTQAEAVPEEEADSSRPPAQPQRRPVSTSSALTSRNSSSPRPAASRSEPTWQDIESLSAEQLKAKPAEWKKKAQMLFRRLSNADLNRKLDLRGMAVKFEALG